MKKTEFKVPSLAEVDQEYAELLKKHDELRNRQTEARRERKAIEAELKAKPTPAYRSGVAALLGENVQDAANPHVRLRELRALDNDIETALQVVNQRLAKAKSVASAKACDVVRPEYGRRVAGLVAAFREVASAREEYLALREELERNDIEWLRLTPMSLNFLGDARDGHIQRFIREAEGAGYGN